jgi:head-tail adaptor
MPRGKTGRMRHYVTIQNDSSNIGDEQPSYMDWMTDVPANVYEVRGSETFRGRQLEANVTHVIETRWYDGILPTHRVIWDSKTIDLSAAIDRDGRKRFLELHGNQVEV